MRAWFKKEKLRSQQARHVEQHREAMGDLGHLTREVESLRASKLEQQFAAKVAHGRRKG